MKKIWLDLELREDIDDVLTLCYALENNDNIVALSVNNPSTNELKLFNYILTKLNKKIEIYVSGKKTIYEKEKDINEIFLPMIKDIEEIETKGILEAKIEDDTIVFCGGSLTSLNYLKGINKNISGWIQGGFASYKIVPKEALLKKFKKRESVPTWNLNLDLKATDEILGTEMKLTFVSKNICHEAFVSLNDLNMEKTIFNRILTKYLKTSNYKDKCLHDLLAYLGIHNKNLIKFKKVNLKRTNDERSKWWSEEDNESRKRISVEYDSNEFKKLILGLRI